MEAVTDTNFSQAVLQSSEPVLVDFWAEWCAPCRDLMPHLTSIEAEFRGRLKVVKVNYDKAEQLAQRYKVTNLPTLIIFRNGAIAARRVGGGTLVQLRSFAQENLRCPECCTHSECTREDDPEQPRLRRLAKRAIELGYRPMDPASNIAQLFARAAARAQGVGDNSCEHSSGGMSVDFLVTLAMMGFARRRPRFSR